MRRRRCARKRCEGVKYLDGYAVELKQQARQLYAAGRLGDMLQARYSEAHTVRSDAALREYVGALKARHLRQTAALSQVAYDNRLRIVAQALGTHTRISRVQGSRLKAKREIRIASVFKDAPAAFLRMIVVHELAHLREPEHVRAFYALCCHMEPNYHQIEFDLRLWLNLVEGD